MLRCLSDIQVEMSGGQLDIKKGGGARLERESLETSACMTANYGGWLRPGKRERRPSRTKSRVLQCWRVK